MSLIEQLKEEIARRNREEGQIDRAKNEIKELYELLQTVTSQKEQAEKEKNDLHLLLQSNE